jgi:hypothetical protein
VKRHDIEFRVDGLAREWVVVGERTNGIVIEAFSLGETISSM